MYNLSGRSEEPNNYISYSTSLRPRAWRGAQRIDIQLDNQKAFCSTASSSDQRFVLFAIDCLTISTTLCLTLPVQRVIDRVGSAIRTTVKQPRHSTTAPATVHRLLSSQRHPTVRQSMREPCQCCYHIFGIVKKCVHMICKILLLFLKIGPNIYLGIT